MALLPNFIVAGAPRCGTSALFAYLAAHPEVAASSVKEVQYFMDEDSALFHPESNYLAHGLDGYRPYFAKAVSESPDASVVFEATPSYMFQRTAVEVMPGLPSSPRFLFQLRKPSDQVYSSYLYSLNQAGNLSHRVSFREFALGSDTTTDSANEFHRQALAFTEYVTFLSRWRAACGDERIRVTTFEALGADPPTYLRELASWLAIDPDFYDTYDFDVVNRNVAVRARGAQSLVRRLAPPLGGRAREVARGLYRRVNTKPPPAPSEGDRAVMAEIDERLEPANRRLADRFRIDLQAWGVS
jgi:Sulfotransferase family